MAVGIVVAGLGGFLKQCRAWLVGGLVLVVLALASPALAAGRVALVIGNGAYPTFGTLANPTSDADDMTSALRGIGFSVTEGKDVGAADFAQLLSNFATAADDADVALFYYSGHGLQFQNENYLLPVDAKLANRFALTRETMSLSDVMTAVSAAHAALLFIDACRSFPIEGTFFASAKERIARVGGLTAPAPDPNTFVGFSSQAGQTASDGVGRNSPFTAAMLEYLPQAGLDIGPLFSDVTAKVVQATSGAQRPQSFGSLSAPLVLVADTGGAGAGSGATAAASAYAEAKAVDTLGAYRAFVAAFPGGFYANLAYERIAKLTQQSTPAIDAAPAPSPPPTPSTEVATLGPAMGVVSGTLCDQLAGVPDDPGKQSPGVTFKDLDGPRAVQACQAAVSMQPSEARYYYQLSRALTVTKDIPNAVAALKQAADLKYPSAMYQYAIDMRDGIGMTKNVPRAVDLMKKAAAAGSGDAMASLAVLYSRGGLVPRDDKVAFGWNQRGADANNPVALNNLAAMYRDGRGTPKDTTKATELFERGIELGYPPACFNLAWMLNGGQGVTADYPRAAALFTQATTLDHDLYDALLLSGSNLNADTIKAMQTLLQQRGDYVGPIDGNFDSQTIAALARAIGTAKQQ